MSGISEWESEGGPGEALLYFDTEEAVPAAQLAGLITALASEYSRINPGRSLVVLEARTGSLYLLIADSVIKAAPLAKAAVDYIAAGDAVVKLVGAIASMFERSKTDPRALRGRSPGAKIAREAIRLAADRGSGIDVRYKFRRGEEDVSVRLEANETRQIQALSEMPPLLPTDDKQRALPAPPRALAEPGGSVADHAAAIAGAVGSGEIGPEARRAVQAIVEALKAMGLADKLFEIASALEGLGRPDVARLLQ